MYCLLTWYISCNKGSQVHCAALCTYSIEPCKTWLNNHRIINSWQLHKPNTKVETGTPWHDRNCKTVHNTALKHHPVQVHIHEAPHNFLWWHLLSVQFAGLSLSFKSPVAWFSTPVAIHCGWILSTTGSFTCSIKEKSSIFSHNRCYGSPPLMTALVCNNC